MTIGASEGKGSGSWREQCERCQDSQWGAVAPVWDAARAAGLEPSPLTGRCFRWATVAEGSIRPVQPR